MKRIALTHHSNEGWNPVWRIGARSIKFGTSFSRLSGRAICRNSWWTSRISPTLSPLVQPWMRRFTTLVKHLIFIWRLSWRLKGRCQSPSGNWRWSLKSEGFRRTPHRRRRSGGGTGVSGEAEAEVGGTITNISRVASYKFKLGWTQILEA